MADPYNPNWYAAATGTPPTDPTGPIGPGVSSKYGSLSAGLTPGGYDTRYVHSDGNTSRQIVNPDTDDTYTNGAGQPRTFYGSGGLSQFGNQNLALLGGDPNNPGSGVGGTNTYANQQSQRLQQMADAAAGRTGPQANTGAVNMMAGGVGQGLDLANRSNLTGIQALQTADRTNLYGVRQGLDLANLAQGQAVQGQMGLAGQLEALGQRPPGPSVAEQQLRMGADRSMAQQMAMAAGARGGNVGLAQQNAAAAQGQAMGQLNESQALVRAQEDLNNRMFSANALQGASNVYGQAGGQQQGALAGAANVFGNVAGNQVAQGAQYGNIANNQVGQANTALGLTNTYAGLAGQQLGADVQTQGMNDETATKLMGMGYDLQNQDRMAALGREQNVMDLNARLYGINRQVAEQEAQRKDSNFWNTIGAVTGGVGTLMSGASKMSDIRAKTSIVPAEESVADAFRPLSSSAYFYKDQRNGQGQQFGPMAQELEQTPAGSTAVTTTPDGKKAIDTGRLALLNASATADMKRELDRLKGKGDAIRNTTVQYPTARLAYLDRQNAEDSATLERIAAAERAARSAMATPTTYPTPGGGYGAYGY